MEMQQTYRAGFGGRLAGIWLDGLGGQEDELADEFKGKSDPHSEVTIRPKHETPSPDQAEVDAEEIEADLDTRTPG